MAGDWQMLRLDIHEDPAVIAIARELAMDVDEVVGKLARLWGWANRQLTTGNARGVTDLWVDDFLGAENFAKAMLNAGWLRVKHGQITFPRFDRWMSETAKQRALAARRVAKHRKKKCNGKSVTKTLPQNNTVQKKETTNVVSIASTPKPPSAVKYEIPPELDTPAFGVAWVDWLAYRKERKLATTPRTFRAQLKKLAGMGAAGAIQSIEQSITNGWNGIFEPKEQSSGRTKTNGAYDHPVTKPAGRRPF